jgi:hypothetical protein
MTFAGELEQCSSNTHRAPYSNHVPPGPPQHNNSQPRRTKKLLATMLAIPCALLAVLLNSSEMLSGAATMPPCLEDHFVSARLRGRSDSSEGGSSDDPSSGIFLK